MSEGSLRLKKCVQRQQPQIWLLGFDASGLIVKDSKLFCLRKLFFFVILVIKNLAQPVVQFIHFDLNSKTWKSKNQLKTIPI
jgi:hypothetical protein